MIYCFDTYYINDKAKTSCLGISEWTSEAADFELNDTIGGIHAYESGSFYKRELPCLKSILKHIELVPGQDTIVIDGFVVLDDDGNPGLGGYLYDYLNSEIPVIGVAKNNFATIHKLKREVYRGTSQKPLYVTAKGVDLEEAHAHITNMHGDFRIPTILKQVDSLCRMA